MNLLITELFNPIWWGQSNFADLLGMKSITIDSRDEIASLNSAPRLKRTLTMDDQTIALLVAGSLFICFVFFVTFMADRQLEAEKDGQRGCE